jgi:hypothetical protein
LYPAQGVVAQRLETAAVADHRRELGRDQHLAAQGLAQRLDARDFVDRRPDYSEVETVDSADIAIEHLPEMEREVDRGDWLARSRLAALSLSTACIASVAASRARRQI